MSMEEALRRIEDCRRDKTKNLDLTGLELETLPDELFSLRWLTVLKLGINRDTGRRNYLYELSDDIKELSNLEILNLRNNRLLSIPNGVMSLTNLRSLVLSENKILMIPDWIDTLKNLQNLSLTNNQFNLLPEGIGNLKYLKRLAVGGNYLKYFPEWITIKLLELREIYFWGQDISEIPKNIVNLSNLELIWLSANKITQLPEGLETLRNLKKIYLDRNDLSNLPRHFYNMRQLEYLNLRDNPLDIPYELLDKPDNPIAILDYIRALQLDKKIPLSEVKILVVGEADVGKSSLIEKLIYDRFKEDKRETTPGIVIEDWQFTVKGRDLTLHLWDFGGQEIMHNTHRLFLTTRSCYLLVLDATQNEESNKVVHWLKTIATYAPDAPVIIAINKSDKFRLPLNLQDLSKHHPIVAAIDTSCMTGEGLLSLRASLEDTLAKLPHLDELVPQRWMKVRRTVATSGRDYLDKQEFQAFCEQEAVGDTSQSIADVLHYLGVLFTYSNDHTLRRTHLLNPNWVTQGIYPILTDPTLNRRGGIVTHADIERILPSERYPPDILPFIVGMMFNFELAFEVPLQRGHYLVPDLLPKEPPKHEWDDTQGLLFVYQYDFLPAGIFSRFVVQMQAEVNPDLVWRSGVLLHQFGKPYARVAVNGDARTITLSIQPPDSRRDPRPLLDTLRHRLETLHATFPGLKVTAMVPISPKGDLYAYEDLLDLEKQGFRQYYVPRVGNIDVTTLLDGISRSRSNEVSAERMGDRDRGDSLPHTPRPAERQQQRKRLLTLVINTIGTKNEQARQLFLEFAGLGRYIEKLNVGLDGRAFSQQLVMELEKAGLHPDDGRPALDFLLEALCDEREGHPDDVAFLRGMMRV